MTRPITEAEVRAGLDALVASAAAPTPATAEGLVRAILIAARGAEAPVDTRVPDPPVGRRHPDTSHEAAALLAPRFGSRLAEVLYAAVVRGDRGVTDDELEVALRMRHESASSARNRLERAGWLVRTDLRRTTRRGRRAGVYVVPAQVRDEARAWAEGYVSAVCSRADA